ncbi:hypothetical protein [Vibrio barjaei]|uniref:hypothetical protein n=1 Tax=Vibrio barjaei TaxID=1676683 RepID=UPI0022845DEA|nr:hypothetical protein [Vibrio barjaei]MCY9874536.1 hypothetical protein [Vibrio barjaei]
MKILQFVHECLKEGGFLDYKEKYDFSVSSWKQSKSTVNRLLVLLPNEKVRLDFCSFDVKSFNQLREMLRLLRHAGIGPQLFERAVRRGNAVENIIDVLKRIESYVNTPEGNLLRIEKLFVSSGVSKSAEYALNLVMLFNIRTINDLDRLSEGELKSLVRLHRDSWPSKNGYCMPDTNVYAFCIFVVGLCINHHSNRMNTGVDYSKRDFLSCEFTNAIVSEFLSQRLYK